MKVTESQPHSVAATRLADVASLMRVGPSRVPVTTSLIVINVLVFAAMLASGAGWWHSAHNGLQLAWGANFGPATKDGEWWRLGTAMFLHFGVVHLAMNMWALWDVGRLMERWCGGVRFLAIYLISGLLGNLVSLSVQGDRAVSGGASGAIFGLYGALLVSLWRERRAIDVREFRWLFGAAAVFSVLTLGMGFVIAGIDNAAHIGGLLAGALSGLWLARPLTSALSPSLAPQVPSASPGDAGALRAVAAAALLLLTAGLALRIPEPPYKYADELQAREAIARFVQDDRRLSQRWQSILETGLRTGQPFDRLALDIETGVAGEYQHSAAQLARLKLAPGAPSAPALAAMRNYAALRGAASSELVQGLRTNDTRRIRAALEAARQVPGGAAPAGVASATAGAASASVSRPR